MKAYAHEEVKHHRKAEGTQRGLNLPLPSALKRSLPLDFKELFGGFCLSVAVTDTDWLWKEIWSIWNCLVTRRAVAVTQEGKELSPISCSSGSSPCSLGWEQKNQSKMNCHVITKGRWWGGEKSGFSSTSFRLLFWTTHLSCRGGSFILFIIFFF